MKKVAVIGIVGVPANYGGFETLIDNIIGENCSADVEYTIFCSKTHYYYQSLRYKGAKLRYIDLNANGSQSILYDGFALSKSWRGFDAVLVLGVSGAIFMPMFKLFSKAKLITNIDGLEWKRGKWGGFAKLFLRLSEEFALRYSDVVIGDNEAIVKYISRRYKNKCALIAYGGDNAVRRVSEKYKHKILSLHQLDNCDYAFTVCRIEPENNCDMILSAFSKSTMNYAIVGNWYTSKFGLELKEKYSKYENIHMIDALYDLDQLYVLRSNSRYYIHGHSAGGTNPSLVEAMCCGCNILAYHVNYNIYTTENKAHYFGDEAQLLELISANVSNNVDMMQIANDKYIWKLVAKSYESLY